MCWGNFVLFPVCWKLLIMERCYILSRAFSSFIEGIILFASFILLMWCIMFIDVSMLLKFTKLLDTNMSNSPSLEHFPIVQHTCLLSYDYPDQLYLDSQAIFFFFSLGNYLETAIAYHTFCPLLCPFWYQPFQTCSILIVFISSPLFLSLSQFS